MCVWFNNNSLNMTFVHHTKVGNLFLSGAFFMILDEATLLVDPYV